MSIPANGTKATKTIEIDLSIDKSALDEVEKQIDRVKTKLERLQATLKECKLPVAESQNDQSSDTKLII